MPFISVVVPTVRVGGLDILFDSLKKQTFTDFELVLVDGLYERRKNIVAEEARDRFLAVRHVGLSPTPKHCAFCAYANAGVIAATGEVVLFCVDYSRLPPGVLAAHAEFHRADPTGRAGMMSPHRYIGLDVDPSFPSYGLQEIDRYERDVSGHVLDKWLWSIGGALNVPGKPHEADGGVSVAADADPKLRLPAGPIGPEYFHAKGESVRRARILEINGWDTDLDGAHLYQDSDFADRLSVKAGVRWMLDPSYVVEIANPRHVFPYMRRTRPHEDNFKIWQTKKAAGYPDDGRQKIAAVRANEVRTSDAVDRKRIAMVYGEFSSAIHGPFDIAGLYKKQGLTGSESSFFNLARSLSRKGHEIAVFCNVEKETAHESGFQVFPIRAIQALPRIDCHAVIAWNEPDYLRFAPKDAWRFCDQQLNDFGYCQDKEWRNLVDVWVSPSKNHRENVMREFAKCEVIPNSADLSMFHSRVKKPGTVVYSSSPDRGLHHLLSMWPLVKRKHADASLTVYYRLAPWLDTMRDRDDETGKRARYIEAALPKLAALGVSVAGMIPNTEMAERLAESRVLAYPCDPVRYTEGYGCSVLDACAAGCMPIISNADALGEVHGGAARVLDGPIDYDRWSSAIADALSSPPSISAHEKMLAHARANSMDAIADKWERLIMEHVS